MQVCTSKKNRGTPLSQSILPTSLSHAAGTCYIGRENNIGREGFRETERHTRMEAGTEWGEEGRKG